MFILQEQSDEMWSEFGRYTAKESAFNAKARLLETFPGKQYRVVNAHTQQVEEEDNAA